MILNKIQKLFGGLNLTWPKLIVFSIIAGAYTAIMEILPVTNDTSFADIRATFEVWILFGILIIMNSKSPIDSASKCFVFFLISQPLIYLIQAPFNSMGFDFFQAYGPWFICTLFTFPMGFIGYFMKKNKWWGLFILTPILLLLGGLLSHYIIEIPFTFPFHLLTILFCFTTLLLYPLCIFSNKKVKIAGVIISTIIIFVMLTIAFIYRPVYNTTILVSNNDVFFDEKCNAYLENDAIGKVNIEYNETFERYVINAGFTRKGKTNLIIVDENDKKTVYELSVGHNTYDKRKK